MKRMAERQPGVQPYRGYLAKCMHCGLVVVHARITGAPLHMHRYSKKCAELAMRRRNNRREG